MDDSLERLNNELIKVKQYYPYRIIWGYIDEHNNVQVFASKTKRTMNNEMRKQKYTIYVIE